MTAKAGLDDQLLAMIGFGELDEEDAGGEVVDIGYAERDETVGELVGNDLVVVLVMLSFSSRRIGCTLMSKDENLCFMLDHSMREDVKEWGQAGND